MPETADIWMAFNKGLTTFNISFTDAASEILGKEHK